MVDAPTVMADGARAGEVLAALVALLPAATVTWMPEPVSEATALSRAVLAEPPSDMVAIEGRPDDAAWVPTQLSPEML
jgi:hypothetical protein